MKKLIQCLSILLVLIFSFTFVGCSNEDENDANTVSVTFSEGEGYTVNGNTKAKLGEAYEFTVTIEEGYKKGADYKVVINLMKIAEKDGKYVYEGFNEDFKISVYGVEPSGDLVKVTYDKFAEEYTINGADKALIGKDYEFTLTVKDGYEKSSDFCVKAGNLVVTEQEGKYIVKNVSSEFTITVTGIEKSKVNVNFGAQDKYSIVGEAKATIGEKYTFAVSIKNGYETGNDFKVEVNGQVLTKEDGVYSVIGFTADFEIKVSGINAIPKLDIEIEWNSNWNI